MVWYVWCTWGGVESCQLIDNNPTSSTVPVVSDKWLWNA